MDNILMGNICMRNIPMNIFIAAILVGIRDIKMIYLSYVLMFNVFVGNVRMVNIIIWRIGMAVIPFV